MRTSRIKENGFTFIEIIVVVVLFSLLATLTVASFVSLNEERALSGSVTTVKSVLSQAQSKTLSSEDDTQYGVHFDDENEQVVLFEGGSYTEGLSSNVAISLLHRTEFSDISLTGGSSEVVFKRITGAAEQSGTVTLRGKNGPDFRYATVTIHATGVVE